MKKLFLIITLVISGLGLAVAQEDEAAKREKMFKEVQEFKMKYLAQEMDLSEVQKKKFYELYEEMSRSKKECYASAVKMDRTLKHEKDASDEDYRKVTEAFNKANSEWTELETQYNDKFAEFLSQKQIYKMKEAEKNYRDRVEQMKHSRKKEHHNKQERSKTIE